MGSVRVIMLVNSLNSGGAEKQMLWIARTLVEEGIPCAVVELSWSCGNMRLSELIEVAAEVGVEFLRAALGESYLQRWLFLNKFIANHTSAIVWTWGFRSDLAVLLLSLLGIRNRWICSLRTANRHSLKSKKWLVRACASRGASYVSNTLAAHDFLTGICPTVRQRSHVIYNFVPETRVDCLRLPATLPRPLRVVMLGNIDLVRKGYNLVLALAEILRAEAAEVEIHVAGRPDPEGLFVREIAERHLEQVVFYHGETGTPDAFLRSGHCYLLTSPFEGMPNSLLEATSLALPTISTKVGDLERIAIDRVHMRLVASGSTQGLRECLGELMIDWPAAVEMGFRGRRWCLDTFEERSIRTKLVATVQAIAVRVG